MVRAEIARFQTDLFSHFKYIPSDDLLNDDNVKTVLESERSSEDPKVLLYIFNIIIKWFSFDI